MSLNQPRIENLSAQLTLVEGRELRQGEQAALRTDGFTLIQLGGVLLAAHALEPTAPPLNLDWVADAPDDQPFLRLYVDGDACWAECRGRILELQASAARALLALCREPGRFVHDWDIQNEARGMTHVPKLVSRIRGAFRSALNEGWITPEDLRAFVRQTSSGADGQVDSLEGSQLLRRWIVARRGHGYSILLPREQVAIEERG